MLQQLFYPENIAVVGASRSSEKVGFRILQNLLTAGFGGNIFPVNPNAEEILGLTCYGNPCQCPQKIDLSIIAVSAALVKQAVKDSIDGGAKAIAVVVNGFKESGVKGAELEHQIAELCKLREVRLLGPSTLGLLNTDNKMNAFLGVDLPKKGGISMISQSSSICTAFLDLVEDSQLGVAKVINLGNKAELSEVEMLRALGRDRQTQVVIGYLESINAGDNFVKAAEEASFQKPVIILKAAGTDSGRRAVAAHSGELIASDIAYGAAFKRAGVIRAKTFGALFDFASAFSMQPLPQGDRVLVITNSGGLGIIAVDAIARAGLSVAYLDQKNKHHLRDNLPALATIYNPLDLLGDAGPKRYKLAIQAAINSSNVDAVIVVLVNRPSSKSFDIAEAIISCTNSEKPIMVSFVGGQKVQQARSMLRTGGIPDFDSPEHAVAALKAMWGYVSWRKRPPRIVTRFKVNRRRVERIIARRLRTKRLHIGEVKAKAILAAYDFLIPSGHTASSIEDAVEVAERIGYPVAMKIVSPDITHKADIGGVRLNIANRTGVMDAFDLMMLRVKQRAAGAYIEGIYLEKMLDRGLEIVLGMKRDPQFGPMLMFGLGGIYVEVLKDVAFYLAPITFDEAIQMLKSTKSYEILVNSRGEQGGYLKTFAICLQKISQLSTDFPQIAELEINLLMLDEYGSEPYVADARISLRDGSNAI